MTLNCFNPLTTNVPYHIETSHFICPANHLTGFCMLGTLVANGLTVFWKSFDEENVIIYFSLLTQIFWSNINIFSLWILGDLLLFNDNVFENKSWSNYAETFFSIMVSNTDNLLQLNGILDLSLTYKIFSIWLIKKSKMLPILYSWSQFCNLGQKRNNLRFTGREEKKIYIYT